MLHVHRADRADALAAALGAVLADPLADPFAAEVVGVPTRGVERWLTQTLSASLGASAGRADGIVANVRFPSPRDIVDAAVAAACGIDPDSDPWAPARMLWPLLDVVDEQLGEPWLRMLADHLADSAGAAGTRTRRLPAVRHLARLYDRYALDRPAMLRAWQAGEDVDGAGAALGDHVAWQAQLWRALRARIDQPSPAERQPEAAARLREDPAPAALPERLAVFGLTRLPVGHGAVLDALAAHRDVHLFVLHPSPALWAQIAGTPRPPTRAADPTATIARNRLLASWGRDVRELQLVLGAGEDHLHAAAASEPRTLLARIQRDVREDRMPDSRADADDSIEVHSCHGRARQVEVLRDAILGALQRDATLQPRDVIVMCPDIEAFAPLIHATFGIGEVEEEGERPDLRVRLADRAIRQTNPVLGTIGRLLELADQRLTASDVLDLADRGPVRRRFDLDDDDLARIKRWIAGAEIRWGLDAAHREPFKLAKVAANTWRAGLDRVLLGVTMTEDEQRLVDDVLPLDDVGSADIDRAGRLAELVDRLQRVVDAFAKPLTMAEWAEQIGRAADLLTATGEPDAWQRAELDRLLTHAADSASQAPLDLTEVRELLGENLRGRPTRANFRTGHLTFCTLNPMRTVPHRVVCLLGLDDGVFPRIAPRDGDDLIVEQPHVGDRDGRAEDRQMLLDALMAAQDKLIVTYTGNDERTNAQRPPAVPVGELLDVIERTAHADRETFIRRHPLQPFDPDNFDARAPRSFDAVALGGAQALSAPRQARPPFLADPLPDAAPQVVELDALERFVAHPARAFLRARLGVTVGDFDDELADDLPIDLDPLEQWAVGERLLGALLAGAGEEAALNAERARGALPPGRLADDVLNKVLRDVRAVAGVARQLGAGSARESLDVRAVAGERIVSGTVAGLDQNVLQTVTYSRVAPRLRLVTWVRLLALTVAHPERAFAACTIGRARLGAHWDEQVSVIHIAPLDVELAREQLVVLLDLLDRGMRAPAPLALRTSAAYAVGGAPAAEREWTSGFDFEREDRDREHQLLLGGIVPFAQLWTERHAAWALRLWSPLLAAEEIRDV